MLEKNGMLPLTQEELELIKKGEVPESVKRNWGLEAQEVEDLVKSGSYKLI